MPVVAVALVAVAVVARIVLVAGGGFYWDDLILLGRAGTVPMSWELLGHDHDGHLMPAGFLLASAANAVAPLQWWPAATFLVVMVVVVLCALHRALHTVLGAHPAVWWILAWFAWCPLTLPPTAWWASGVNSLPLQAALAWVSADVVAVVATGRRRHVVSAVAVTAVALAFVEKAVAVPFVAMAVAVLALRVRGARRPIRRVLRAAPALWFGLAVVVSVWAVVYATSVHSQFDVPTPAMTRGLMLHGIGAGVLPALFGGPWWWSRWEPGPPWADPPAVLVAVAALLTAAIVVGVLLRRRRTGGVVALGVGYVVACTAAMIGTRAGQHTAYELAQTLRYYADAAVVLALCAALVVRAPRRARRAPDPLRQGRRPDDRRHGAGRRVFTALTVATVVGALVSTVTFSRSWWRNPTPDYLATAVAALRADPDEPVLDAPVSIWVLLPVTYPNNLFSHVFSPIDDGAHIGAHARTPRVVDEDGRLAVAHLWPRRWLRPGPEPGCGHRIDHSPAMIPLDHPIAEWDWVVQVNYLASRTGTLELRWPGGAPVTVPVEAGPGTVYAAVSGGGDALEVRAGGGSTCVDVGGVGVVVPD